MDWQYHGISPHLVLPAHFLPVIVFLPDGSRVYVTNLSYHHVSVIETETNTIIEEIPIGDITKGIAVLPDGSRVFVSSLSSGTVSVLGY